MVAQPVKKGEEFTLIYTHSVHRSPVVEVFAVDPRLGLVLKKTGFCDYGVGIPYSTPYDFYMGEDDFFGSIILTNPWGALPCGCRRFPSSVSFSMGWKSTCWTGPVLEPWCGLSLFPGHG